MALKLLVDTCVWLDLARDHREAPTLDALHDLIEANELELIVPQLVLDEFDRCKGRVITDSRRSLQSHIRMVRDAVNRFGDEASKAETLRALGEIDHKIVTNGDAVNDGVGRVEALLKSVPPIATSCVVKQRVTERAIARMAPYHRDKNSVGDAILIEIYADLLISRKTEPGRFAFVTHNTNDFSEVAGDRRKPHADIANLFTSPDSTYWVSMVNLLHWLDPDLLADHQAEFNYSQQPRGLSEILEAEHLLFRQVWYNRHWNLRCEIEQGTHHVVSEKDYSRNPYRNDQTLDTVWAQALEAAKRTEEDIGPENLGPWDDFEWGMINGKLSALRWVLGDEWDMLDS
ncbi:MAG: PIN domain-containing protein [Pseudorhodoplanes sp.]|uniref:PIN domain-containing protein n=1 Tax=Methylocystis sp. TaxID=1911079 RepID=UPI003D0EE8C6